ncbi:sialidase family protein [Glutamicibacter ectropisis]|uniref:Sialidase family protein n=1 Tax=Glutamicibacter ectropisis TaxID=3046593 RepID=A0AAU6WJQ6_9MICC
MRSHVRHEHRKILVTALALSLTIPSLSITPAMAASSVEEADPTTPPGTYTEINLGSDRTDQNFFYRIPALAHLGNGVVLAAWDARPSNANDAPNPNSIVQRISTDNGATWGPMTTIAAGFAGDSSTGKYGYSDPVMFSTRTLEKSSPSSFTPKIRASPEAPGAMTTATDRCSAQPWSSPPTMAQHGAHLV